MVEHLIFNCRIFNDYERNIINLKLEDGLSSIDFEYYKFDKSSNLYNYETYASYIEFFIEEYNFNNEKYAIINSLEDFYIATNQIKIYELW